MDDFFKRLQLSYLGYIEKGIKKTQIAKLLINEYSLPKGTIYRYLKKELKIEKEVPAITIYNPNEPVIYRFYRQRNRFLSFIKVNGRFVRRSRYVMECHIGRKLIKGEIVHHIDLNPINDDIANLKLLANNSEHQTEHNRAKKDLEYTNYIKELYFRFIAEGVRRRRIAKLLTDRYGIPKSTFYKFYKLYKWGYDV